MLRPFIFVVSLLLAIFLSTEVYGKSLKQQLPPIVILYPDGTYYTLAYGEDVYVSDRPVYSLQGQDLEIRLIQIEPWAQRDFEVQIVPKPEPELIITEEEADG